MRPARVTAAAAAALALLAAAPQGDSAVVLRAVRFLRAEHDRTRVKGLIQIPFSVLRQAPGSNGRLTYTVTVRVADSSGLTLHQQSWQSRAQAAEPGAGAYTVEIVDFAVAPGKYRLEVGVQDSVSGRTIGSAIELQALSDTAAASDLLLAPEIRLTTAEDTVPRPGEFRTGNNLVTAAARVRLTPLRSWAYYLLEAYSDSGASGELSVAVRDSAGGTPVRPPAMPVSVAPGGSILKGKLDLAGLPGGAYTMVATLRLGGRTVERSAGFVMAGLGETLARDTARRAGSPAGGGDDYFAQMGEPELNRAGAPLVYIADSRELAVWNGGLSLPAKRRFLAEFWQRRDPTPGTPDNERRDAFYRAIEVADREYREGGRRAIPGWRSDRGRIYVKYGPPGEVLRRQQEGRAPRYEVWRYARGKGQYYIFADRTGFGTFQLIHTNDLAEAGLAGWGDILGRPAVTDVSRWLGVNLQTGAR